jgi:hypothetical protein
MKNTLRQVVVSLTVLITIVINILADALPINGLNTGAISDKFKVYFVPAGYVFAIWGIIYIGLIAYAVYQALPAQRANPRLQATGWWVVLGGTLAAMLVLLTTLIAVYQGLGIGRTKVRSGETWAVRIPFSIYLGWITVATVANVSDVLDTLHPLGFSSAAATWMVVTLAVVLIIAGLMNFLRRDVSYAIVILWALAGIAARFPQAGIVTLATWVTFGLVAASLVAAFLVKKNPA